MDKKKNFKTKFVHENQGSWEKFGAVGGGGGAGDKQLLRLATSTVYSFRQNWHATVFNQTFPRQDWV
jgi:hypothetical protein